MILERVLEICQKQENIEPAKRERLLCDATEFVADMEKHMGREWPNGGTGFIYCYSYLPQEAKQLLATYAKEKGFDLGDTEGRIEGYEDWMFTISPVGHGCGLVAGLGQPIE